MLGSSSANVSALTPGSARPQNSAPTLPPNETLNTGITGSDEPNANHSSVVADAGAEAEGQSTVVSTSTPGSSIPEPNALAVSLNPKVVCVLELNAELFKYVFIITLSI